MMALFVKSLFTKLLKIKGVRQIQIKRASCRIRYHLFPLFFKKLQSDYAKIIIW